MPFGPTGYSFTLDSYNASANTVGGAQSLDRITECNGINPESQVSTSTALGDDIGNETPTGMRNIERVTMKGYADASSSSAFKRIGRPAKREDYPARTLTVTYRTGMSQAIEVVPVKNNLIPSVDDNTMFEAEFAIVARSDSDYVETGLA